LRIFFTKENSVFFDIRRDSCGVSAKVGSKLYGGTISISKSTAEMCASKYDTIANTGLTSEVRLKIFSTLPH
jgi:hypothetical protein